jgi:hypothetical protein
MMPAAAGIMRLKPKIGVQVFKKSETVHCRFLSPQSSMQRRAAALQIPHPSRNNLGHES